MKDENADIFGAPRLGFGCARLHGAVSARDAETLLETALDHGLTHFDTARAYGWGAAEIMLGALARRRRDEMVIVSKAGIAPPGMIGRALNKLGGRLSPAIAKAGEPKFGQFGPEQITRSVEASLAALGTDRLDALLLHEVRPEHVTDELKRALEDLKRSGKALRVGIGASPEASAAISAAHPEVCEIVQLPAPELGEEAPSRFPGALAFHSVLGERLDRFARSLGEAPARAARFAQETGCDARDRGALARLLLRCAARHGVALFSSTKRENIVANAAALSPANDEDVRGLKRFLAAA